MAGARTSAVDEVVVCGVDGSAAGFEALRQAIRLLPSGGRLVAVTVHDPTLAIHAGWDAARVAEQIVHDAGATRDEAAAILAAVPNAETRVVVGKPAAELEAIARRRAANLLVVGTHGHSRAAGIVLGGVATTLLHEAPCPVLVARAPAAPEAFPRVIAVGTDGSAPAHRAVLEASGLAARFGAELHVIVATGGRPVELDALRHIPRIEWDADAPVDVLVAASREVDLLVVGSRGLHGIRALGSVSEQVAHKAACSVLVVRPVTTAVADDPVRVHAAGGAAGRALS
jgi:nucleotide-binding universal stress UspA family protein